MATPDSQPREERFDCVEMKRKAQEQIQTEIQGMSVEEELAYWKKYEDRLRERIEAAKRAKVA